MAQSSGNFPRATDAAVGPWTRSTTKYLSSFYLFIELDGSLTIKQKKMAHPPSPLVRNEIYFPPLGTGLL